MAIARAAAEIFKIGKNSAMKIHYHVGAPFVGGAERQLQYLIKYLRKLVKREDLTIAITYEVDAVSRFVRNLDPAATKVTDRKSLFHALEKSAPDIVQFYTSPIVYRTLGLLKKRPRAIEVIHNKNQFPGDATSYPKDRTHVAVCVSPDAARFILTHCPDVATTIIPNGVDTDQFYATRKHKSSKPLMGFAGRLCPDKGIDALLDIASKLPCDFELVGQKFGDYKASDSRIRFYPHTDRPEDFYWRWWAFVSASPHESFGMSVAEAMACGTAPIILNSGGITSYLTHGKNALIADTHEELRIYISRYLQGQVTLDPLSISFSAQEMAASYLALYQQVVAGEFDSLKSPSRVYAKPSQAPVAAASPAKSSGPTLFAPFPGSVRVAGGALGITPKGWYGVVRSLAGFCDVYATPEQAAKVISDLRPRLVVLGCFQNDWLPICRLAKRSGAKVVATWHASYILNEFHEINRKWMVELLDAYRAKEIDFLATPHKGLAASWSYYGFPTAYFPNLVNVDLPKVPKLPGINIGILGSGQNWKNMECQIIAAGMIPGAKIHVQEVAAKGVISRFGIQPTFHPKTLSNSEYYALLGGMSLNLCVSLSEVYSYLTAESFLLETPVFTSSITPIIHQAEPIFDLDSLCATAHFEDPVRIRDGIQSLLNLKDKIGPALKLHMERVNEENKKVCLKVLEGWR